MHPQLLRRRCVIVTTRSQCHPGQYISPSPAACALYIARLSCSIDSASAIRGSLPPRPSSLCAVPMRTGRYAMCDPIPIRTGHYVMSTLRHGRILIGTQLSRPLLRRSAVRRRAPLLHGRRGAPLVRVTPSRARGVAVPPTPPCGSAYTYIREDVRSVQAAPIGFASHPRPPVSS